jgi:hypothetical protein
MAWYVAQEDAGHISVQSPCTFSECVGFCKTTNAIILSLSHVYRLRCLYLVSEDRFNSPIY